VTSLGALQPGHARGRTERHLIGREAPAGEMGAAAVAVVAAAEGLPQRSPLAGRPATVRICLWQQQSTYC